MEVLAEAAVWVFRAIFRWIFIDLFLAGWGWLYLTIRYRSKEKRREILQEKYEGAYRNIIRLFFTNVFYYSIGIPLVAVWLVCVVFFFYWISSKALGFLGNLF